MTLRWRIRPRLWHDGRPVTCGDYVFAIRLVRDRRAGTRGIADVQSLNIANASCPAGATGRELLVHWKKRYAYANLAPLPTGPAPRHILEPIYRQNPDRLVRIFGVDPAQTVGDGPYRIQDWRKGESLTLEAVPGHPFGTPRLRRITYRFIPNPQARLAALLAGEVDALSPSGTDFDAAFDLERRGAGRLRVLFSPPWVWEHIDFNPGQPAAEGRSGPEGHRSRRQSHADRPGAFPGPSARCP